MACCLSGVKVVLFFLSAVNFFIGCVLLGLGVFISITTKNYSGIVEYFEGTEMVPKINIASWLFITVGFFVALVSFFGCCAVCSDKKWMFYAFAIMMSGFIVIEIAGAIVILVYDEPSLDMMIPELKKSMETYRNKTDNKTTIAWDNIQTHFKCCGIEGPLDWNVTEFENGVSKDAPDSCCKIELENCGVGQLTEPYASLNSEGCFEIFNEYVKGNLMTVGGTGLGIALAQIIMVFIAGYIGKVKANELFYV